MKKSYSVALVRMLATAGKREAAGSVIEPRPLRRRVSRDAGMMDLASYRPTAQLGGQGFDLAAGLLERTGAIDFLGGEKKFLFDGKLGGDAAPGFGFA